MAGLPRSRHPAAVEHGEAPGAERREQVTHVALGASDLLVVFLQLLFKAALGGKLSEAGRPVGGEYLEVDDEECGPLLGEPERRGRRYEVFEGSAVHDRPLAVADILASRPS